MSRTDRASRLIKAAPEKIYAALTRAEAIATWRAPSGMRGVMHAFDPRPGGVYRMSLIYEDESIAGKSGDNEDAFEGRFVELVPDKRVVEAVVFTSDDPAFAGEMTITTELQSAPGGTEVMIACSNVPSGISASDHQEGLNSSLANLAAYVE